MTVFIYVNTSKQVGDVDHLKVFANADAAETRGKRPGRRCL
jgi:methylphosphotriester-DNA--protein-cysteine methyltransferase